LAGLPRWSVSPGHREQALSRRTPGRRPHPASLPARWPSRRGDPARTRRRGDGMSVGDITAEAAGEVTGQRPELVQLLTPEGERVEHPEYALDLAPAEYRDLYRDLVLVRRIDTEATALQRQGELGIWASLLGQEAAQVGSGRALQPDDFAFPTYREHGVAW